MPQNTMGSYTGHQVQPIFKTGVPQQQGQTPLTPQTGLGTGLPPPVPVSQNIPSFNFGGSPIYGGPAISQADIQTYVGQQSQPVNSQAATPRTQLIGAILERKQPPGMEARRIKAAHDLAISRFDPGSIWDRR